MVKTAITTKGGSRVVIQGTPEEVAELVKRIEGAGPEPYAARSKIRAPKVRSAEPSIKDYVLELRDGGLFKEPQRLGDVQKALKLEGHIVPRTTLSGVMLGLVKKKELRRLEEKDGYRYVKR